MKTYQFNEVLTDADYTALVRILTLEKKASRTPHLAIMTYLNAHPEILAKCKVKELLPDFFAYQLEYYLS